MHSEVNPVRNGGIIMTRGNMWSYCWRCIRYLPRLVKSKQFGNGDSNTNCALFSRFQNIWWRADQILKICIMLHYISYIRNLALKINWYCCVYIKILSVVTLIPFWFDVYFYFSTIIAWSIAKKINALC